MNIPQKVKILYKEYEVQEHPNIHNEQGDLYGQIQYLPQVILLNSDASGEAKKATLIHEVLHGLDEMYHIELTEEQIEKLGNALYMFVKDNEEMFNDKDCKNQ